MKKVKYSYPGQKSNRFYYVIISGVFISLLGLMLATFWIFGEKIESINNSYKGEIKILETKLQEKEISKDIEKSNNENEGKYEVYEEQLLKAIQSLQPRIDPSIAESIINIVLQECKTKELDPELILALIFVESGFNHLAESEMGAVGLMQVRYETWKETPQLKDNGVEAKYHLFWISENIQCGTTIFKKYLDREKGNIAKALRRYNSGKELTTHPIQNEYVNKVTYTLLLIRQNLRNQKVENDKTNIGTTDSTG